MKYILAIAAVAAISGAAALAGEKADGKCMDMGKQMQAKAEDHFKAVDADANGQVTEAELLAFVTAKAKAEFSAMTGDDGVATLDEMKAHHASKHDAMMKDHGAMDKAKAEGEGHDGHH